jgi:hypothetical protein
VSLTVIVSDASNAVVAVNVTVIVAAEPAIKGAALMVTPVKAGSPFVGHWSALAAHVLFAHVNSLSRH